MRRVFTFLLIILLVLTVSQNNQSVNGEELDITDTTKPEVDLKDGYDKVTLRLSQTAKASKDEYIPIIMAIDHINLADLYEYEMNAGKSSGNEISAIKSNKYDYIKGEQTSKNWSFLEELDIDYNIIYISRYLPILYLEVLGKDIDKLSEDKNVKAVDYLDENFVNSSVLTESYNASVSNDGGLTLDYLETIGVYDVKDDYGVSGLNQKVGIWEIGTPDNSNPQIMNKVVESSTGGSTNIHTTSVAILFAGNDGVAHNSTIYSVDLSTHTEMTPAVYFADLDTFIEYEVDVINVSALLQLCNDNYYDIYGMYTDYFVTTFDIPIVAASGNNNCGNNEIDSYPQLAQNVITVGATSTDGNSYADYTSYNQRFDYGKPNIVAPGGHKTETGCGLIGLSPCVYNLEVPDGFSWRGTSYSAPLVTGVIALMYEYDPSLKNDVTKVISLINASGSIDSISDCQNDVNIYDGLSDKCGSGLIDARKIFSMIDDDSFFSYSFENQPSGSYQSFVLELNQGEDFVLSHFYLYGEDRDDSTPMNGCYIQPWIKIFVIDPNGNHLINSHQYLHHHEVYRFEVQDSGLYTILIVLQNEGGYGGKDKGTVSWFPSRERYTVPPPPASC